MKTFETVMTVVMIVYYLVYIIIALNAKKPFTTIFLIALSGLLSLAAVDLTQKFTGVYIPINPYTVGVSASGGIAGTVLLLVLKFVFAL